MSERKSPRQSRIAAYRQWRQKACDHFKSRGLTRSQLKDCSEPRILTRNCLEALDELHSKGLVVAIISVGIHKFVGGQIP
jgi:hypothetical protein